MTSQPHKTDGVSTAKLGTSRGDDLNKRQKRKRQEKSWVGKERGNDSSILRTNHQRYTEPYHLFFFFICNKFKKLKGKKEISSQPLGKKKCYLCPCLSHVLQSISYQKASTSRLPRASKSPPMALRRMRVAKFLGPSSSAPEGGPRGCLVGWLTILWLTTDTTWCSGEAEEERPIPRPSYNFLDASSRGERGISLEDAEDRGVVGEE